MSEYECCPLEELDVQNRNAEIRPENTTQKYVWLASQMLFFKNTLYSIRYNYLFFHSMAESSKFPKS